MTIKSTRGISLAAAVLMMITALFLAPLHASAEAHGNFYIPEGAVPAGSEFEISVEFTADDTIGTVQAAMTYSEDSIEFISGDSASGGGGIVNIKGFPDSAAQSLTVSLRFKALTEGSSQINLTNGSVFTPDGTALSTAITAYATITVGPAAANDSNGESDSSAADTTESVDTSGKALLKSLTLETGELRPEFSPGIYDYTVTVPHEVDLLELEGVTMSENDSIWYEGAKYLADGVNQQTITVTAPDGTQNVYTVTIYRETADGDNNADYTDDPDDSQDPQEQITSQQASSSTASRATKPSSDETGVQELRDKIMPAMYVAMIVIVLAVIILIVWIRSKSKNKLK